VWLRYTHSDGLRLYEGEIRKYKTRCVSNFPPPACIWPLHTLGGPGQT